MNRQTIRFEPNQPVTVALEFPEGVHVNGRFGPQVRFSLTDARVMYLDPDGAQAVATLGVKPGESFRITKRVEPGRKPWWDFERIRAAGAILGNSSLIGADPVTKNQPTPVPAAGTMQKSAQPGAKVSEIDQPAAPRKAPPVTGGLTRVPPQRASYGDAFVEILRCIRAGLNETGEQWSDQSVQAMASTMFIQAARDGKVQFGTERRVA